MRKKTGRVTWLFVAALALVLASGEAGATDPTGVTPRLEGCRNDGSITLPDGSGKFICPDSAYTSGNLGKGWNELDLVPYRLTLSAGTSAPATQTYTLAIAVDREDAGRPGYDVLSVPVLNTTLSSTSCAAPMVGAATEVTPGVGGIHTTLYRLVTITQARNTTCVYDYYARLALGSHLFPGSSLHANLLNEDLSTSGIGARDVSIPVREILPQELRKTMIATQDRDVVWNIVKAPTPARLTFPNTCSPAPADREQDVSLTVTWTKQAATPSGDITVITNIYAKNPASRTITVNVTDVIRSGTTALNTAMSGPVNVPANTEQLVLTHTAVVPAGSTGLNDVAVATYTDPVTSVPVPGTTTATASAVVQPSGIIRNDTAVITDLEHITGDFLEFAANSFSGATGSFLNGYVPGTFTTMPITWRSGTQSTSGSVSFSKTVRVTQPSSTSGHLLDTALLEGADGFTTLADVDVDISTLARVDLTISKSIPNVLSGTETETFFFEVVDSTNTVVALPSIGFTAGETSDSVTVGGLMPGSYTVREVGSTSGKWELQPSKTVTIMLPSCAGTVTFANTFHEALAKVRKVTQPAGSEAGWTFTLQGPGLPAEGVSVTTTGTGLETFPFELLEGAYHIEETARPGFEFVSKEGCDFTVDYPADAGRVFECTFTNRFVPTGKVAPTETTCQDFTSGTAGDITQVMYGTRIGRINNTSPGVFFYYSRVTAPSSSFIIDVRETKTHPTFNALFAVQNINQIRVYNADCTNSPLATVSMPGPGQARISITGATPGQVFIVSVKYDTSSVVGQPVPSPNTVHYDFDTLVNATVVDFDVDGVNLVPRPGGSGF
ncbi:hypothetical protein [Vitiosangium sp. GDMCC 1.1324]|uniref:hypothetical protein n=1 Tax=Vitiosangium sp. (strain GDMCC 1.1324) TaxID=2138576 RepID=UPI0011B4CFA1|nr:hypothetical protein [Vitiosangium sp. GDMCC 1.1324]